ncbi:hypothetical protein FRC12_009778 [Ceratobasidium sp. 428]|nr:hypothetical protein FRC12_009778 [Ceratobasidium sp. 428]
MNKVKLAVLQPLGRKLAIKIVPRVLTNTPGTPMAISDWPRPRRRTRGKRSDTRARPLYHPDIHGICGIITRPGHYCMVSEYTDGSQMHDYIISSG